MAWSEMLFLHSWQRTSGKDSSCVAHVILLASCAVDSAAPSITVILTDLPQKVPRVGERPLLRLALTVERVLGAYARTRSARLTTTAPACPRCAAGKRDAPRTDRRRRRCQVDPRAAARGCRRPTSGTLTPRSRRPSRPRSAARRAPAAAARTSTTLAAAARRGRGGYARRLALDLVKERRRRAGLTDGWSSCRKSDWPDRSRRSARSSR